MENSLDIIEGGWFELPTMINMYCDLCNMIYDQSAGESWSNVSYLAEALSQLETTINRALETDNEDYKNITNINDIPEIKEIHKLWD